MKPIFLFDIKSRFQKWGFYILLLLIVALGFIGGQNARFSVSENIFLNSPYQISFITTFLSLTTILFSTIFASQLLFKEADARFELLLFSTPVKRRQYLLGRYAALFAISFVCVLLLIIGFFVGQSFGKFAGNKTSFVLSYYLYPIVLFAFINTLFTTSVLSCVGWFTKNKLLVYVSGLLLYIVYMVALMYSGSPLMAQSMPQSEKAQLIAAYIDPFGFSAFFHQTSNWSVLERNTQVVSLSGIFFINRLGVLLISTGLLFLCVKKASLIKKSKHKKVKETVLSHEKYNNTIYKAAGTHHRLQDQLKAMRSFTTLHLIFIFKSIPFVLTALALLFAIGMEMYAEIEKGIRIPQKYASSGLMVSTIIQNFHGLCIIAVVYYAHELFWRSHTANFYLIENSTANFKTNFFAKWLSLTIIILAFSVLMIFEGVAFQFLYNYPKIELTVYLYVFLFTTFPLILLGGLVLLIHKLVRQKYIGLGLIVVFTLIMATPLGKRLVSLPLLKFLQTLSFDYSDMNGFGEYIAVFEWRLIFGLAITGILLLFFHLPKSKLLKWQLVLAIALFGMMAFYTGTKLLTNYQSKNSDAGLLAQASYEKGYRKYQTLPQPTITNVITSVDLFPENNAYTIKGNYLLKNKTCQNINEILVNFGDDFIINKAVLITGEERIPVTNQYQVISLHKDLLPDQEASFEFDIHYQWKAVNGHQSFNAIVANGSFMRISRYYPVFGYMADNEVQDEYQRKQLQLGKATPLKQFDAPKSSLYDYINLDMTISTSPKQIAIGVGELKKEWKTNNRNYFQYQTSSAIPFRFALSSAEYAVKKEIYKGKSFEIYFHPTHDENVEHLLKNAKLTIDYCERNFGPYPFNTIRFAEISNFTRGFAATAYPATIYMTEDMIFHANLKGDKQQDVINELAGHELSHLWWGNNSQMSPDEREGATMLSETFAMYTEMMLLKKMYGKEKMLERIKMHLDIYNSQKGFAKEQPLYKVKSESTHISYSKGAVVMYQLSEMIGEEKVNRALHNFLVKYKYPNPKPITTDFIDELYKVVDVKFHKKIEEMFIKVTEINEKDLKLY